MAKTSIYKSEEGKAEIQAFYEGILSQWQQPCWRHNIPTHVGNTFVIESGDKSKPAMVLLHGSGSNSAMWANDVKTYGINFHVFAIDIPGECGNSSEGRIDFKGKYFSNWLEEVFHFLKIPSAILAGCSLGGWIALDFAIRLPKMVNKLVLLSTAGITQIKLSSIFWIVFTSILGNFGFKMLTKMVYGDLEFDEATIQFSKIIRKNFLPRTDMMPLFSDEELHKIQSPTLFIGGDNDCFYNSFKTYERMKTNLADFEGIVLKDTGHVVLNQQETIENFALKK